MAKLNEYGDDYYENPLDYLDYDDDYESEEDRMDMDDDNFTNNYIENKSNMKSENIKKMKKQSTNEIKMKVGDLKNMLQEMVQSKKTKPQIQEVKMTVGQLKTILEQQIKAKKSKKYSMKPDEATNIIESLVDKVKKSNNPYKNLSFVDGVAKKFGLNESFSNGIKTIIKKHTIAESDGSKTLYNFISKKCGVKSDAVYNQIAERIAYPMTEEMCESCVNEEESSKKFQVKVKKDGKTKTCTVSATSKNAAIKSVMKSEKCGRQDVVSAMEVSDNAKSNKSQMYNKSKAKGDVKEGYDDNFYDLMTRKADEYEDEDYYTNMKRRGDYENELETEYQDAEFEDKRAMGESEDEWLEEEDFLMSPDYNEEDAEYYNEYGYDDYDDDYDGDYMTSPMDTPDEESDMEYARSGRFDTYDDEYDLDEDEDYDYTEDEEEIPAEYYEDAYKDENQEYYDEYMLDKYNQTYESIIRKQEKFLK